MRLMRFVVLTTVEGIVLSVLFSIAIIYALTSLAIHDFGWPIFAAVFGSFIFSGWKNGRQLGRQPAAGSVRPAGKRSRGALMGIALAFAVLLTVVLGLFLLEHRAESNALAFCDQSLVGKPMDEVAGKAAGVGTRMLRIIKPDHVAVGFTGFTPFSRHMCDIKGENGRVTEVRYFYLD